MTDRWKDYDDYAAVRAERDALKVEVERLKERLRPHRDWPAGDCGGSILPDGSQYKGK